VAVPRDKSTVVNYRGNFLAAVVKKGNIYGTQFHPEKSRVIGIKILQNFARITSSNSRMVNTI